LAIPAYGNEIIGMLKGSALASTVTLLELTGMARKIVAATYAPYEIFVTAGLIYLAITFVVTRLIHLLEYRLNPHLRPLPRQG
jgi:ABC-type arginine/histidine transport system permease subunit